MSGGFYPYPCGGSRRPRLMCWLRVGVSERNERQDAPGAYPPGGYAMTREHRMTEEHTAAATGEFDNGGNVRKLHRALLSTRGVEEFLYEITVLAARLINGGLSCGMTMQPDGKPATVAFSDPLAARVDEVQYQLDDGPCLHAVRDGHMVRIEDTAEKARWPEFEAQAASHGIRSCLALPLSADGKPVGALNLYAREAWAFGAAEAQRAENF